jgi:hypothetical protein
MIGGLDSLRNVIVVLILSLIGMVTLPFTVSGASISFTDVKQYKDEIAYLTNLKIISGYPDRTFQPNAPIKRIQALQMILREMGINTKGAPDPGFKDMKPGSYGYEEVAKAVELGIISGKQGGVFDPNGTLTRAQMSKILVNAYDLFGFYPYEFKDVLPKDWAYYFISTLAAHNITSGYPDGTFKPNNQLTRSHFALFMSRLLNPKFQPHNPLVADSLLEGAFDYNIIDYAEHPTQPIIYILDASTNAVVGLNYKTYEIAETKLPLPGERLALGKNKLYVTLPKGQHSSYWWDEEQKGAFGVIDPMSMKYDKTIHINLDPFDIAADDKDIVYISSGSGQHSRIESYNSTTGEILSSQRIYQGAHIKMHPSQSRLYAITPQLSPSNYEGYPINEGILGKEFSNYNNPTRNQTTGQFFEISPDGKYIFDGTGIITNSTAVISSDLTNKGKLDKALTSIAFDLRHDVFYTSNHNDYITAYTYSTMRPSYQLKAYGEVKKLFYKEDCLIAFTDITLPQSAVKQTGIEIFYFQSEE